mmetsp:Transcript_1108/g.2659  ORF Transcript_1108/g.2659 Transcript_1108/m.2659 type:complete len:200 (-) Transcript_1108:4590-5189(-)
MPRWYHADAGGLSGAGRSIWNRKDDLNSSWYTGRDTDVVCSNTGSLFCSHTRRTGGRAWDTSSASPMAFSIPLQAAPSSTTPRTTKPAASANPAVSALPPSRTVAWRRMSSSDQPCFCAAACLVAVMKASGLRKPPSQMGCPLLRYCATSPDAAISCSWRARAWKSTSHMPKLSVSGTLYRHHSVGTDPFTRLPMMERR